MQKGVGSLMDSLILRFSDRTCSYAAEFMNAGENLYKDRHKRENKISKI